MEKNHWKLSGLGVLAVFTLLTLCILGVLLTGAGSYQAMVSRGESSFENRTAAQYLTTRLRQADRQDAVAVEEFEGVQALTLAEEIGGRRYVTRVYCFDGWLRELFAAGDSGLSPADGEKLLEMERLTLSLEGSVLTAAYTLPGESPQTLTLLLRSGKEVAP